MTTWGAEVGIFTGADEGEGLDLQGNFTYAVRVGPEGGAGLAGDAVFTGDSAPGVSVSAGNNVAAWHTANYGDTESDNTLETVMRSIRWSDAANPAIPVVTILLDNLEVGIEYKLQLLFAESCCNRGFDVFINGNLEVDEFSPQAFQGGINNTTVGAVITHPFIAESTSLEIILDGRDAAFPDRNAIINGLTLERISLPGDLDGDGLADDWETVNFGDLSARPQDDADSDGLTNLEEFQRRTLPRDTDTDDDGLTDGLEAKTIGSNPLLRDTDLDTIPDGDEVNIHGSSPTSIESDGDGFSDYDELRLGTKPGDKNSFPTHSSVGRFTGGDDGEGLDLDGAFVYAVNIGTPAAPDPGAARDAVFTSDSETSGVIVEAGNEIPNWHAPNYGDSEADDVIEYVMRSIRWSNAGTPLHAVTLTLDVEVGSAYQLQLMFAEQCCAGRAFDVLVEDRLVVDEFNPSVYQGGAGNTTQGALVTHRFIPRSPQVNVVLFGRGVTTPAFTDHNAIFNAFTLEVIDPNADTDADGLPDPWERDRFASLVQTATADPDADGLQNAAEFANGTDPLTADTDDDGLKDAEELGLAVATNPLNPDTDGDGLKDGPEVKTYGSDPHVTDTDGDGIIDGQEVVRTLSNPAKADSDDDGFMDDVEFFTGTNPSSSASRPGALVIQSFTGGDDGEGLDLDGSFLYAVNVGSPGEIGQIRDAYFAADSTEGVIVRAPNEIPNWHAPEYGESDNDNNLELVMQSMRWNTGPVEVDLVGLTPGRNYKLQLLYTENCCAGRGFDLYLEDQLFADEFNPAAVQRLPVPNTGRGAVVSYTFVAVDDVLNFRQDGRTLTTPALNDPNPILSGLTLEELADVAAPVIQAIAPGLGGVSLTFTTVPDGVYLIEYKARLTDPAWESVGSANGTGGSVVFTDTNPDHRFPARSAGFWRVVRL